jgi:transposase
MVLTLSLEQKNIIVEKALRDKKTVRRIAREIGCSKSTVSSVMNQFLTEHSLQPKKYARNPPVMDLAMKLALDKAVKKAPSATAKELKVVLEARTGRRISERSIQRGRRSLRYHPVHAAKKPALTEQHAQKRLRFCRAHRAGLANMVFMDEMGVELDHGKRLYWIKQGQQRPVEYRHPRKAKVNVWAAIWHNGHTPLYCTTETFNSERYVQVLQNRLRPHLPLPRKEFLQDGVPWHWTHAVQDWCVQHNVPLVQDFPPSSPDLNAIEYVWGWIKHKVEAANPQDQRSLERAVRAAWANLPQDIINSFIGHMTSVIRSIIANEGWQSN